MAFDVNLGIGEIFKTVADKLFPDPVAKANAIAELAKIDLTPLIGQLNINALEAQSKSWFEANWRPFVGWVCGVGFAYKFVISPFLIMCILIWLPDFHTNLIPQLDWPEMSTVLFGMLGLSYHRTQDKSNILDALQK